LTQMTVTIPRQMLCVKGKKLLVEIKWMLKVTLKSKPED
jgi:hypothetical protein